MRESAVCTVETNTGGDLGSRPPGYTRAASYLQGLLDSLSIYELWEVIFGQNKTACADPFSLEVEFVQRVNAELFPVDLGAMDQIYYGYDGPILDLPIPVAGWRLPWETMVVRELPGYQQAAAACIIAASGEIALYEDDEPPWPPDLSAEELLSIRLAGWEDTPEIPWLSMDAPPGAAGTALKRLTSSPLPASNQDGLQAAAGLADLVRNAITGPTGNPFLDLSSDPLWDDDYDYCDIPYYWYPGDIRRLADLYSRARPIVERIEAFRRWFEGFQDAKEAQRIVLQRLEAAGS
jgi:hypothetical protein